MESGKEDDHGLGLAGRNKEGGWAREVVSDPGTNNRPLITMPYCDSFGTPWRPVACLVRQAGRRSHRWYNSVPSAIVHMYLGRYP